MAKKKEQDDSEKEKNLQLFLDQSMRLFEIETKRWNELDSKSIQLVGFIGIFTSIIIFGVESIKNIQPVQLQILATIFALMIVSITFFSFIIVVLTLMPNKFRADPNPITFRKEYYNQNYKYTIDVLAVGHN